MFELRLQIFIIIISILFSGVIFYYIRKEILDLKYSLIWIIIGILFLIMAFVPQLVLIVSQMTGFELPVNSLFMMGIIFMLIIIFSLTVTVSALARKITRLAQEISLLKQKIDQKEKD